MQKPNDYETTAIYVDFKALPSGGYVCRIMGVEETKSQQGNDMLKISLDIFEGEYKGYYADKYRSDTRMDKKWGCVAFQLIYDTVNPDVTNRGFKTFCTAAEESNQGFKIQWGDGFAACFKNKLIGCIFRREEFIGTDNSSHFSVKPFSFRSADSIRKGDFTVPEDKLLNGSVQQQTVQQTAPPLPADLNGFEEIGVPDGELPF